MQNSKLKVFSLLLRAKCQAAYSGLKNEAQMIGKIIASSEFDIVREKVSASDLENLIDSIFEDIE